MWRHVVLLLFLYIYFTGPPKPKMAFYSSPTPHGYLYHKKGELLPLAWPEPSLVEG